MKAEANHEMQRAEGCQLPVHLAAKRHISFFNIYLTVPVLSYNTQDLRFLLHVQTHNCGVWDLVPDQGSNLGRLHWECGILATELIGKSPSIEFDTLSISIYLLIDTRMCLGVCVTFQVFLRIIICILHFSQFI